MARARRYWLAKSEPSVYSIEPETAWDPDSRYHDPRSTRGEPVRYAADARFLERFDEVVPLDAIKADPHLSTMMVAQRGHRPSVQPVGRAPFQRIARLGRSRRGRRD